MKILHTSDWHLGHQLYGYDREEEQRHMLRQIEEIVRNEQPDAMLVSGDVYHTAQPSAAVQRMFADTVMRIRKAHPAMYIIITAGNHDSGSKHEIFRNAWQTMHVYTIGHIERDHQEEHIIRIGNKGIVIAVPYVNTHNIPEGFYQQLINQSQYENSDKLPIVLMAHTTVSGLDWKGHEDASDSSVGGIDAVRLEDLGFGYDYLALGHIHRQQWVAGSLRRARYSGSPLAVSFDEAYTHSVSIVDITEHGSDIEMREIEIENLRPLVRLPLGDALPWDEARAQLKQFIPECKGTYLQLKVLIDDFLPATAFAEAQQIAKEAGCRYCPILTVRKKHSQKYEEKSLSVDELQREQPEEIAKRYATDQGGVWDEDMSSMFKEILARLNDN